MGNFSRFVQHLDGLISVYNLPEASAADKTRAWTALTVLEQDLETIFSSYRLASTSFKKNWNLIVKKGCFFGTF